MEWVPAAFEKAVMSQLPNNKAIDRSLVMRVDDSSLKVTSIALYHIGNSSILISYQDSAGWIREGSFDTISNSSAGSTRRIIQAKLNTPIAVVGRDVLGQNLAYEKVRPQPWSVSESCRHDLNIADTDYPRYIYSTWTTITYLMNMFIRRHGKLANLANFTWTCLSSPISQPMSRKYMVKNVLAR